MFGLSLIHISTPEEQETLANYVGWGGLADAFDAGKAAWSGEYKELKADVYKRQGADCRGTHWLGCVG